MANDFNTMHIYEAHPDDRDDLAGTTWTIGEQVKITVNHNQDGPVKDGVYLREMPVPAQMGQSHGTPDPDFGQIACAQELDKETLNRLQASDEFFLLSTKHFTTTGEQAKTGISHNATEGVGLIVRVMNPGPSGFSIEVFESVTKNLSNAGASLNSASPGRNLRQAKTTAAARSAKIMQTVTGDSYSDQLTV